MKKITLLTGLILSLLITGCDLESANPAPEKSPPERDVFLIDTGVETELGYGTGDNDRPAETTVKIFPYFRDGDVEFTGKIKLVPAEQILEGKTDQIAANFFDYETTLQHKWTDISRFLGFYEVGTIKKAPYKGQTLLMMDLKCDGMCFRNYTYRFAWDKETNSLTLLKKQSDNEMTPAFFKYFVGTTDNETYLEKVELPATISFPGKREVIKTEEKFSNYLMLDLSETTLAFTNDEVGNVYKTERYGCLYVMGPDGATTLYNYDPEFFDGADITVTWEDGGTASITDGYKYAQGGCGIRGNCYEILNVDDNELKKAGTASNGMDLYILTNPLENASELDTATDVQKRLDYSYSAHKSFTQMSNENGDTPVTLSFEEYNKKKPLIFWQDPQGRWSALMNADFTIPAECGKPVIYLYPETTTDVHVEVEVDEFTVTIPDYGSNGWTVQAQPNGTLYNYADGQNYPYLFWEGIDKDGINANKGSVVKKENLESFLDESLIKLGLNETEKADFVEFWYPRMMENPEPYLFVSFVGTADFNKVAPLHITPAPDTLIRVFMYYQPEPDFYSVPAQNLTSIPRTGFTVLEWGGTSSRPWKY